MESASVVWGLDIGHTSIKAVKLERSAKGGVVVLGYCIEPIHAGDEDRDEAVVTALRSLAQREEFRTVPVVVSLSGRQIFARTINIPVINKNKVAKMVELEARQQIPGNFDEVRWGYHLSPGLDGASNDVALFAAREEIVDNLIGICKRSGINLVGISVSSLAVYNFVQFDQDFRDEDSVIVLDVGAENTDLVVYQGDTLWMRSLGVSGNDITRTFMKKFRVSFEEAENLKCQVGDSRQAERILKVVESSLTELISEVQRSLGFYKSQNSDASFENVVVSGNTFRLPNLAQFMADRLGYAIITLIELEHIEVAGGLDRDHFLDDLQSLGVAMGLGLQGLGEARANVNLLPSSLKLQGILAQKRWAAIALLIIIPVAFAATYLIRQARLDEAALMTQTMEAQVEAQERSSKKAKEVSEQIPALAPRVKKYEDYGEHVGLMGAIESGVFNAVAEIAADDELLGPDALVEDPDLKGGQTPMPQACYLERLHVPAMDFNDRQRSPFQQLGASRAIEVHIRVPAFADRNAVLQRFPERLRQVRQTATMWKALHPAASDAEVPADGLPPLFSQVESVGDEDYTEQWIYYDPTHRDETGRIIGKDYLHQIQGKVLKFSCTLRGS